MYYMTTRNSNLKIKPSEALLLGLGPDGGLLIPSSMPKFKIDDFASDLTYPVFCHQLLMPFFAGDPLQKKLKGICERAFNFPLSFKSLGSNTTVIELFHGPTLSFKDYGARFLAECLNDLADEKLTLMVATSGDTGSAVASAFYQKSKVDVIILFPYEKVSKRQQQQLTCWDKNVHSFAVKGTFDDCQSLVKQAFKPESHFPYKPLCTANSINIGRLLPQVCYYAYSSCHYYRNTNQLINFIVPSGNLGNVTAAYWAQQMGFPINKIHIATNANKVVLNYLESGQYKACKSINTLANAMDVGNPSNFERLQTLFPNFETFKAQVNVHSIEDDSICEAIKDCFDKHQYILCPHTATAYALRNLLGGEHYAIVATADPSKFETIIEPIINKKLPISKALSDLLKRKESYSLIHANLDEVRISS